MGGVLELKPVNVWEGEGMAFIEYELGSHTLAIGYGAPEWKSGRTGATAALEADDFAEAVKKLKDNKVQFIMEPHETSVCHMALFADTEGNQIMIHKRKVR